MRVPNLTYETPSLQEEETMNLRLRCRATSCLGAVLALAVAWAQAPAAYTLKLKNSFISQLADRVGIEAQCTIDHVSGRHSPSEDGDRHIVCRSASVGLRVIAEIKNAKYCTTAETFAIKNVGKKVRISGIWRLWFEHPQALMRQGGPVSVGSGLNQKHVFEIHPVAQIGPIDVRQEIGPIAGFTPYSASHAFTSHARWSYARGTISIARTATWTTIVCDEKKYNHVSVRARLLHKRPSSSADGTIGYAEIEGLPGKPSIRLRIVTLAGTEADDVLNDMLVGETFKTLAIPRINLKWVDGRPKDGVARQYDLATYVGGFVELIGISIEPD